MVPAILPHMMAGFRLAVVVSWGLVVAAEFMGAGVGLGWLMIGRSRYLDNAGILVIVFIFAALAILSDFLLRAAAKRFTVGAPEPPPPSAWLARCSALDDNHAPHAVPSKGVGSQWVAAWGPT